MSIPTLGKFGDALPPAPPAPQAGTARDGAVSPSALKTQPPSQPSPQPSPDEVEKALQAIREKIQPVVNNDLQFSVDRGSGDIVIRVIDGKTGDLVRQIPSEEVLAIARDLDRVQGLFLWQKA